MISYQTKKTVKIRLIRIIRMLYLPDFLMRLLCFINFFRL